MYPFWVYPIGLCTFKGAKMYFFKVIALGVLLLSNLFGRGEFHVYQTFDFDLDGQLETVVLNTDLFSAALIETTSDEENDILWSYQLPDNGTFSDCEIIDINEDGLNDLVLIPNLFATPVGQAWVYIFLGNTEKSFSNQPLIIKKRPPGLNTIRPASLCLVPADDYELAISFGSPARSGLVFNIKIINDEAVLESSQLLTAPIISNGYGAVYIGSFVGDGHHYLVLLSPESGNINAALFDIERDYSLEYSKKMTLNNARYLLGSDIQTYSSNEKKLSGLLLPFGSDDVLLLNMKNEELILSNTNFSGKGLFPIDEEENLNILMQHRTKRKISINKPSVNNYDSSRLEEKVLDPPTTSSNDNHSASLNDPLIYYDRKVPSLPNKQYQITDKKKNQSKTKDGYGELSPTLSDFLATIKDETTRDKNLIDETVSVPSMNDDMKSINWADEAGFTQLNLGEYISQEVDSIETSPIPNQDTGIVQFTEQAIESLKPSLVNDDTLLDFDLSEGIDLYYVLAMTPVSETRDRYVFNGEAPFGVSVNQIPSIGQATHLQHGISADFGILDRGRSYDFAYSLRDSRLDSITTLTMVHDMQTNVVFMSITPTDDSLSQSYQPESFDPKLFEFPDYFFEGFPTSLDMDFTDKLIRFSFQGDADSTYEGIYLSSTTPSNPAQSLAVFMNQGTLQSIRGEVIVRENGFMKVTTEFDLVGFVSPDVMFSRLIQEMFPEELKYKLLQGASLEDPLFGPSGKIPKITREPRLPEVQSSQIETAIPVEPKQSNVPIPNNGDSVITKTDSIVIISETQEDEPSPEILEVEKQKNEEAAPTDTLKLEVGKDGKDINEIMETPLPEKSQLEQEKNIQKLDTTKSINQSETPD